MKAETKTYFEGCVNVCCHEVSFWYDLGDLELTDELRDALTEEAEKRATFCIVDGCSSGDLNCLYMDHENDGQDYEVLGWWKIEKD